MIRRMMSALWAFAVLFTLIEAKQLKEFIPQAIWPYPELGLLLFISFLYLISSRSSLRFDRRYFEVSFAFAGFAMVYVLCALINAAIAPQIAQGELLSGIGRVMFQYVLAPPLVLVSLAAVFGERRNFALRSFILPSVVELVLLVGGDIALAVNLPSHWVAEVRREVLMQSWVQIGSKVFFIPKWGGTFAESQELGFLMLISLLLLDLWLQHTRTGGRRWQVLLLGYTGAILLTASKGVIAGLLIYYLFRNRKYIQHKIAALLLLTAPAGIYLYYRIFLHPSKFMSRAFSYASLDERIFHILYYLKLSASSPLHLLIGFGARQYGLLVSQAYPAIFNKNTDAVSIFSIVADSGLLGMLAYLVMILYLLKAVDGYLPRLVIISGFIATLWMPDWSMECYVFFLLIVLYVTLRKIQAGEQYEGREEAIEAGQ